MRIPEAVAAFLLAIAALLLLWNLPHRRAVRMLLAAAVIALLCHIVSGGPYWQAAPLYLAMLLAIAAAARSVAMRRVLSVAVLLCVALAALFCHVLPLFHLPQPDGAYATGTAVFHLTDNSRQEDAAHGGGPREVVVQAWYPADCSARRSWLRWIFPYRGLAPYRRLKETTALSSYQRVVWTHSCEDAPLASDGAPFPVLLFNPAIEGRRTQSTFLMEELASHGFAVFAIDHPYQSGPVELASGKVLGAPANPIDHLGTIGFDHAYEILNRVVDEQSADTSFALDAITQWSRDPSSRFYRRLDPARAGTLGHSLGGSVAAETAVRDPRIRAVFDMSGPLLAQARQAGVAVPYFFMTEHVPLLNAAQLARLDPDDRVDAEMDVADMKVMFRMLPEHGGWFAELPTGSHASFTDKPLFSPYARFGGGDVASARQLHTIMGRYAVAFFTQTLEGHPESLMSEEPSPFAGVEFRRGRE